MCTELDGVVLAEIVLVGTAIVIGVTNCEERLEINDVFSVRGDGVVVLEFEKSNDVPTELK